MATEDDPIQLSRVFRRGSACGDAEAVGLQRLLPRRRQFRGETSAATGQPRMWEFVRALDSVLGYGVDAGGMRTSEAAAQAAVGVETLRYYERRGLLAEPERSGAGYRSWSPDAVRAVRFIKRAQEVGFSLTDVEELLHLAEGGPGSCEMVRAMARQRLSDLQRRIADVEAMRDALARLVATCERPPGQRECPLLDALDPAGEQHKGEQR